MSGKNRKKLLLTVLLLIGTAVIITGGSTFVYVGSNKFCGYTCHQMKTRAYIWQKSTHNNIKCITCHSEPGIIGEFKAHIDGINYLKSFLKEKTKNLTIFATRRNPARLKSCIHCHPADTLKDESETIRMNHVFHIEKEKLLCTDCHMDMIHGSHSFEVDMVSPKEKKCIICHLRVGSFLNCQSCHIRKVISGQRQVFILDALDDIGIEDEPDR